MLHVLNLVAVLLLPVLVSSFPQSNRWKELYERRLQAGYPTPPNPLEDDRSGPLRRALQELTMLRHQQDNDQSPHQLLPPSSAAADLPVPGSALLPPGPVVAYGRGGLYARKREELLARLLEGRSPAAALPVVPLLHNMPAAASSEEDGGDLLLRDAHKRGGFVGAPGSPGGPNIGDCPKKMSPCRTCYVYIIENDASTTEIWDCLDNLAGFRSFGEIDKIGAGIATGLDGN